MPPVSPFGPAYRIRQGETVVALAWSNIATIVGGTSKIIYDDGNEDDFSFDQVTLTAARALNVIFTHRIARQNGYVVSSEIIATSSLATQRGQTYVTVLIVGDPAASAASTKACLLAGYLYFGNILRMGSFVEPGPAGGHGQVKSIVVTNPGAGADPAAQAVPTGAAWKLLTWSAKMVQGLTQTPLPILQIRDASTNVLALLPGANAAQGASTTVQYLWTRGDTTNEGIITSTNVLGPMPDYPALPAGFDITTASAGLGANSQWNPVVLVVEEWVMPN
jgi:hypothetical protein